MSEPEPSLTEEELKGISKTVFYNEGKIDGLRQSLTVIKEGVQATAASLEALRGTLKEPGNADIAAALHTLGMRWGALARKLTKEGY